MKLTNRQEEILVYIKEYINENHFPPSVRDIAAHFSLASAGGVHKHLINLKKKGYITFESNIPRSIHIINNPDVIQESYSSRYANTIELPLKGKVAAGQPIEHFLENESMEFPYWMIRKPDDTYVLQVQGDSMIEECICDGDYVLVEHRNYADNGDMVIAMINHSEATLKRFYLEGKAVRLQPANHLMKPIFVNPQELSIHGIVVGVVRNYK